MIGQTNLVSNGGFETYTACPNSFNSGSPDLISYAFPWYSSYYSPDYYNFCASQTTNVSVPNNLTGYQIPYEGQAYCGFEVYNNKNSNREVLSSQLITSLNIGQKYYASIRVCLADVPNMSPWGINKIGILFSTKKYTTSSPAVIKNYAQVFTNTLISDSINWTTIRGSFISDSVYQYINVSNFFDISNTDTTNHNPNMNTSLIQTGIGTYYLIDDIRVSSDSLFGLGYVGIHEMDVNSNLLSVFPNPVSDILHIQPEKNLEGSEIEICDALGQTFIKKSFRNEITVSFLPEGVYYLNIKAKESTYYGKRFVVIH